MGKNISSAVAAGREVGLPDCMVGSVHSCLRLRLSSLRYCHGAPLMKWSCFYYDSK